MWFAALGSYRQNPWLVNFCVRLLEGSRPVLALLERNPFPHAPPRYIRAVVYDYHFTDFATRRKTGAWWRRQEKGLYLPPLSLRQEQGPQLRAAERDGLGGVRQAPLREEPRDQCRRCSRRSLALFRRLIGSRSMSRSAAFQAAKPPSISITG